MPTVKTWSKLMRELNHSVKNTLEDDVFKKVRKVYQQHIDSDVYDVYTGLYERRDMSGGLIADENIVGDIVRNTTLEVRDIAKPNESIAHPSAPYSPTYDTQFAAWIERGQAYNGNAIYLFPPHVKEDAWTRPRPFTENTIKDLKTNKQHVKVLQEGLKKRGIATK